jgi:hypothetical protein
LEDKHEGKKYRGGFGKGGAFSRACVAPVCSTARKMEMNASMKKPL